MNTIGTITMTMRELDRLRVIQAVAERQLARPCRRAAASERAADRAARLALSCGRCAWSGVRQARSHE